MTHGSLHSTANAPVAGDGFAGGDPIAYVWTLLEKGAHAMAPRASHRSAFEMSSCPERFLPLEGAGQIWCQGHSDRFQRALREGWYQPQLFTNRLRYEASQWIAVLQLDSRTAQFLEEILKILPCHM